MKLTNHIGLGREVGQLEGRSMMSASSNLSFQVLLWKGFIRSRSILSVNSCSVTNFLTIPYITSRVSNMPTSKLVWFCLTDPFASDKICYCEPGEIPFIPQYILRISYIENHSHYFPHLELTMSSSLPISFMPTLYGINKIMVFIFCILLLWHLRPCRS